MSRAQRTRSGASTGPRFLHSSRRPASRCTSRGRGTLDIATCRPDKPGPFLGGKTPLSHGKIHVHADLAKTIDDAFEARNDVTPDHQGRGARGGRYGAGAARQGRGARRRKEASGNWQVNQWLKKAVLLSFRLNDMGADRGRPRRRGLVGQGALEVRRLGREPLPRRGLSRGAGLRSCAARPTSRRTSC